MNSTSTESTLPHACELMTSQVRDERVPLQYDPQFREYSILLTFPPGDSIRVAQGITYCPWCGEKLPADLRDQIFDDLERDLGGEPDDYFEALRLAPKKYHSDLWWRGRYDWDGNLIAGPGD
ncbi:DUF6980 family protein [Nocardioides yefusunii]|uniref:DUF6980 family protein n=1 Tax=Nocardioides yefusunii TaxID=2500546 RepID=A0ABW1QVB0_9ACTN